MLFDERSKYDPEMLFENAAKLYVLTYTTTLKSYLGPFICLLGVSIFTYFFFEYGEFRLYHILGPFLDWVFSNYSQGVQNGYMVILTIIVVGGTLLDSINSASIDNIFNQ